MPRARSARATAPCSTRGRRPAAGRWVSEPTPFWAPSTTAPFQPPGLCTGMGAWPPHQLAPSPRHPCCIHSWVGPPDKQQRRLCKARQQAPPVRPCKTRQPAPPVHVCTAPEAGNSKHCLCKTRQTAPPVLPCRAPEAGAGIPHQAGGGPGGHLPHAPRAPLRGARPTGAWGGVGRGGWRAGARGGPSAVGGVHKGLRAWVGPALRLRGSIRL